MKIKNKIILGATSLLVLSGVSAATSTFAWYTASRQVDVSLTNIQAVNSSTGLTVKYNSNDAEKLRNEGSEVDPISAAIDPVTELPGDGTASLTFDDALTDVSSKGDGSFVKPLWGPLDSGVYADNCVGGYENEAAYKVDNHDDASWYHQVTFNFKADGTGSEISLYLDANKVTTYVKDVAGSTLSVANSVRVSAVSNDTLLWYANINGTGDTAKYISTASSSTIEEDVDSTKILGNTFFEGSDYGAGNVYQGDTALATKKFYTDPTTGYLGTLDPKDTGVGDNIDVTFYIWIEGTDASTVADNIASNDLEADFNLSLGFHTINMSNVENTDNI